MRGALVSGRFLRRVWLVVLAVPLASPAEAEAETSTIAAESEPAAITVQTSFGLTGQHAPYWVGIAEGFFEEEQLNVTIEPGEGSAATAVSVASGAVDFAAVEVTAALDAVAKGAELRQVAAYMSFDPSGLCYATERVTIDDFADLEGLRVGGTEGGAITLATSALMEHAGADPEQVEFVNLRAGASYAALVADQIDASTCGVGGFATVRGLLEAQGLTFGLFSYRDHQDVGDPIGFSVIVSNDTYSNDPELVQRFVNAWARATIWSIENPEAAIDHFMAANADKQRDVELEKWMDTAATVEGPEGYFRYFDTQIEETISYVETVFGHDLSEGDYFTNEFVDELPEGLTEGQLPS